MQEEKKQKIQEEKKQKIQKESKQERERERECNQRLSPMIDFPNERDRANKIN